MHIVYARFIHMFLFDIGVVPIEEPFLCIRHQGVIKYNGEKMSKSKGNVVSPDIYHPGYLRMYLMFLAHYFDGGSWSDNNYKGIERFDKKLTSWINQATDNGIQINLDEFRVKMNFNFMNFKFNKIISEWMSFYNKHKNITLHVSTAENISNLYKLINPYHKSEKNI